MIVNSKEDGRKEVIIMSMERMWWRSKTTEASCHLFHTKLFIACLFGAQAITESSHLLASRVRGLP